MHAKLHKAAEMGAVWDLMQVGQGTGGAATS